MGGSISKSKPSIKPISIKPNPSTKTPRSTPSFTKSSEILQDGIDPNLDQMLRKLGPVEVPKLFTHFQKNDEMLKILKNREVSDTLSTNPGPIPSSSTTQSQNQLPPNRLTISTICELLDLRKSIPITSPLYEKKSQEILQGSMIELKELESLFKCLNTFSVQLVHNPDPLKHEPMKVVVWTDPPTS